MLISKEKHYILTDLFQVKLLSCAIALFWEVCFILSLHCQIPLLIYLIPLIRTGQPSRLYPETSQTHLQGTMLYRGDVLQRWHPPAHKSSSPPCASWQAMGHSSGGQSPLGTISGGSGNLTQSKPPLRCWHPPAPEYRCASVSEWNTFCWVTKLLSMPIRPHTSFCYIITPILPNVFQGYWFTSPTFHSFLRLRLLRIVTEHL